MTRCFSKVRGESLRNLAASSLLRNSDWRPAALVLVVGAAPGRAGSETPIDGDTSCRLEGMQAISVAAQQPRASCRVRRSLRANRHRAQGESAQPQDSPCPTVIRDRRASGIRSARAHHLYARNIVFARVARHPRTTARALLFCRKWQSQCPAARRRQ